jgi:L-lactate permease
MNMARSYKMHDAKSGKKKDNTLENILAAGIIVILILVMIVATNMMRPVKPATELSPQLAGQQAPHSVAMALSEYGPWILGLLVLILVVFFFIKYRGKDKTPKKKEETTHTVKKGERGDHMVERIVIAACVVAIIFVVIFLVLNREDTYSVVYLKSYSNYVKDNVSFTYAVESHEGKPSSYNVEVLLSNSTVQQDSFQIDSGSIERSVSFPIDNSTQFPAKVEVITKVNGRNYSVHFWLQGFEGA